MLMDIIDLEEGIYESANPGSTTIGEILSRAENAAPGQTRNHSGSARTGSNIGNATVYSKNKRIKLDAAFINCLKNIQKVQQQYSVDDYYQFAVDIGDDVAAQSMVDEAARTAMGDKLDPGVENTIYIKDGHAKDGKVVDFANAILDGIKKGETRTHKNLTRKWVGVC